MYSTEVILVRAFDTAKAYLPLDFPRTVAESVDVLATDRRYKVKWLAASTDYRSALVQYRGHKYYLDYISKISRYTATRETW